MTSSRSFFSGPLEAAETAQLLARIEERLARRGDAQSASVPVALVELGRLFGTASADDATLHVPSAPVFDVRRGGMVARTLKRTANVTLRLFGRPQHHFDHAIAVLLASVTATLHALRVERTRVYEAIERMDERLAQLERRLDDPRARRTT